jgi:molecular chaperone GrpE
VSHTPDETPVEVQEAPEKAPEAVREEELLTRLKYLQAEFENYRKRTAREAENLVKFAHEALLVRLLPVLDEFDAAAEGVEGEAGQGVRMIRDNLLKALADVGLEAIPALGLPFDPYVHECVEQVADEASEDGAVKGLVRKGYRLHDRVLRPAQVIVVNNGGASHG